MNKGLIAGIILIAIGVVGLAVFAGHGAGSGYGLCDMNRPRWWPGPGAPQTRPMRDAITVEVVATDFAYEPSTIAVKAGQPVNIRLVNKGAAIHDLVIPALGFHLDAGPGRSQIGGLRVAQPGEYEFYCSVPGHRERGMAGRLVVSP